MKRRMPPVMLTCSPTLVAQAAAVQALPAPRPAAQPVRRLGPRSRRALRLTRDFIDRAFKKYESEHGAFSEAAKLPRGFEFVLVAALFHACRRSRLAVARANPRTRPWAERERYVRLCGTADGSLRRLDYIIQPRGAEFPSIIELKALAASGRPGADVEGIRRDVAKLRSALAPGAFRFGLVVAVGIGRPKAAFLELVRRGADGCDVRTRTMELAAGGEAYVAFVIVCA